MRIKTITVQDFRAFSGEHIIDFSYDDSSVNLIVAENEVGKTSLLNSLIWCLYGKLTKTSSEPDKILNKFSRKRGTKKARVVVELIDPSQYKSNHPNVVRVTRTHIFGNTNNVLKVHLEDGISGQLSDIDDPKGFVNQFCPEAISEYFFFDGEGIQTLTTDETLLKYAIRNIQGLNAAEGALQDIEKYKISHERDLNRRYAKDKIFQGLSVKVEKNKEKYQKLLNNDKDDAEERIKLETRKDSLNAIIGDLGKDRVTELQTNIKNYQNTIASDKKRLVVWEDKRESFVGEKALAIASYHHTEQLNEFITQQETTVGLPSGYTEVFVENRLKKLECICGTPFKKNDEIYKKIQSLLDDAATEELDGKIDDIKFALREYTKEVATFNSDRSEIDNQIHHFENKIKKDSSSLKKDQDMLESTDEKKINEAAKEIKKIEDKILKLISTKLDRDISIRSLKKTIDDDLRELNRISLTNQFLARDQAILNFLDNTIEYTKDLINDHEIKGKNRIVELMNLYLDQYARGNNSFVFRNDSYSPVILDSGVPEVDRENIDEDDIAILSTGGAAVKRNLFFATSLMNLSKERSEDTDDFHIPGSVAPMVVDAPFANLDSTNIANLSQLLVNNSDQLIIMISSSAYNGGFKDTMKKRENKNKLKSFHYLTRQYIGKNKGTNAEEKKKLETPIIINDEVIKTSFYENSSETSHIVKVKI
tara:strand:- start:722 stop:2842 length:2121 start_codon:yes stop_codon:yes gene_type:complete